LNAAIPSHDAEQMAAEVLGRLDVIDEQGDARSRRTCCDTFRCGTRTVQLLDLEGRVWAGESAKPA
jgi:hypothetical protein